MRIGVDVRLIEELFQRGMGRYTLQQLHAVILATPQHHYVLFCLKKVPPSLRAFEKYPNVTLAKQFVRYNLHTFTKAPRFLDTLTQMLDKVAWEYEIDVFHIPIMMNFIQPIPTQMTACAVVATVYDLIPLIFAEHFPQPLVAQALYDFGIERYKTADYLIAISQATKHDTVRLLGYPSERIGVAYPAVDKSFMRLDDATIQARLTALWQKLGIPAPAHYIFTVTDHFYTKNLDTLLVAYAQLPADLRLTTPLIVTFDIYPKDRVRFMARAKELGVDGQVIFTGRIPEDDLVALYNGALFTVYPSRYEGFGYPIAEAMACGSPVITTTAASMPEVAGEGALLVNPEDAEAMTDAMHRLYHDADLRQSYRQGGYAQASQFNLDALAKATHDAYQQALTYHPAPRSSAPPQLNRNNHLWLIVSFYTYGIKRRLYDKVYLPTRRWLSKRIKGVSHK
ncbi:MAG: glycosyltransferase family 1 protein [bacterium]|nr:glycosyltransferase family 1 protein [bacterium]